ncbi:MAG: hypothetical protein ABFS05_01165 [Bacteroidota bacterium]
MKTIKRSSILLILIFTTYILSSCGSAEDKIPGSWITESVTASVDSSQANLASIDMAIASTKTTKFTLNEDHTMTLSIDGYQSEAFWAYHSEDGDISFRMDAELGDPIELGKLEGNKIIYTSSVKHGSITAVYVKE